MRKFRSVDSLDNTRTIFVKPSKKTPDSNLIINMANQHGIPLCLSNVVYSHGGTATARQKLTDVVTKAWFNNQSIEDALQSVTLQSWTEVS